MISEIYILFFKASLTISHTAMVSQKKSGTSKKIQWDFQISRVGSLDFLDLKVNESPDYYVLQLCDSVCKYSAILAINVNAIKVRKTAKVRKRYNQVPHLTKDTT